MENKRVIYTQENGVAAVIVPAPGATLEQVLKAVPAGKSHEVVDVADIPADRTFRNAWIHDLTEAPQKIGHNMDKAKEISHDKRRAKRAADFAPLDVEATIPARAAQAEAARQVIRDKDAAAQLDIDAAGTVDELKAILEREGY